MNNFLIYYDCVILIKKIERRGLWVKKKIVNFNIFFIVFLIDGGFLISVDKKIFVL